MEYEVEGARPRGRPKKTWTKIAEKDYQAHKLNKEDAMNCKRWRKQIRKDHNMYRLSYRLTRLSHTKSREL